MENEVRESLFENSLWNITNEWVIVIGISFFFKGFQNRLHTVAIVSIDLDRYFWVRFADCLVNFDLGFNLR